MNHSIYPIGGSERELPFYIYGIGFNDWQFDVIRHGGYVCHQIIYCTRGKGRVVIDGKETIITPNMCFFLPANYPHEYYTVGDLWETHWIAFDGYSCARVFELLDFTEPKIFTLSSIDGMEEIFQKIYLQLKTDRIFGVYSSSGLLYSFLLELHRIAYEKTDESDINKSGSLVSVLNYIDLHFTEDIQLDTLCGIISVTPQHLCRIFKKRLSMRPVEYIARKRIQNAKTLLLTTNQSVREISLAVGYRDISYFGSTFRKCEGMSPSEYRKRCGR